MSKKLEIGAVYEITTEDWKTFVKEGHELDGHINVVGLSKTNSFKVLADRQHGWYEAQVTQTEHYEPARGGTIGWRGILLVNADYNGKHFKLKTPAPKKKAKA